MLDQNLKKRNNKNLIITKPPITTWILDTIWATGVCQNLKFAAIGLEPGLMGFLTSLKWAYPIIITWLIFLATDNNELDWPPQWRWPLTVKQWEHPPSVRGIAHSRRWPPSYIAILIVELSTSAAVCASPLQLGLWDISAIPLLLKESWVPSHVFQVT